MDVFFAKLIVSTGLGAILTSLVIVLRPITKKCFSPVWHYYMWIAVLLAYTLPLLAPICENAVLKEYQNERIAHLTVKTEELKKTNITEQSPKNLIMNINEPTIVKTPETHIAQILGTALVFIVKHTHQICLVWILGMAACFIVKLTMYIVFACKMKRNAVFLENENIPKGLAFAKSNYVCVPFIMGLFKPTLYIPDGEITQENLMYILSHELTHYKKRDILYKWFIMAVSCIHWFNPFIYAVKNFAEKDCEISCDVIATRNYTEEEKKNYMRVILYFAEMAVKKHNILSTCILSDKKTIKERFETILSYKKTKGIYKIASVFVSLFFVFVSYMGVTAAAVTSKAYNEVETDIYKFKDKPVINDTNINIDNDSIVFSDLTVNNVDEAITEKVKNFLNSDTAVNIEYSRNFTESELRTKEYSEYSYKYEGKRPKKSIYECSSYDNIYYDKNTNTIMFSDNELSEEEFLALTEFNTERNMAYFSQNLPLPPQNAIPTHSAVKSACELLENKYGEKPYDFYISIIYNETADPHNLNNMLKFYTVSFVNNNITKSNYEKNSQYFIDVDVFSGEIL